MNSNVRPNGLPMPGIRAFLNSSIAAIGKDRRLLFVLIAVATLTGAIQAFLFFVLATIGIALSSPIPTNVMPWLNEGSWSDNIALLMPSAGALTIISLGLSMLEGGLQSSISARSTSAARLRLAQAYTRASQTCRASMGESQLQQLMSQNGSNVTLMVGGFVTFCVAATTILMLIVIPFFLNVKVGGAIVALILVSFVSLRPIGKLLRRDYSEVLAKNKVLFSYASQLERMADDIQAYNVGPALEREMSIRIAASSEAHRRAIFRDVIIPFAYQYGALIGLLAAIALVLVLLPDRQHPGIAVFALLMLRIIIYAKQLVTAIQQGKGATPFAEQMNEKTIMLEGHPAFDGQAAPVAFNGLELRNASYVYPDGSAVLHGISLTINPGDAVAIIGASGGGKSTLCALMLGFKSPTTGSITMDGVRIDQLRRDAWSRLISYVPQNCLLLTASVADNIRFFRDGYSDEQVEAAAHAAHIHDEIVNLPQGYETIVGPGARGLSGGQRQRLTIARALLGTPDLMILDEPTSALDSHSEALLIETLAELRGNTTLVLVGHRPAGLEICDRILRMENGRLLESG